MKVVIAYDISVKTKKARKRYRKVCKICKRVGERLQKSVFEASMTTSKLKKIQIEIESLLNRRTDQILFMILRTKSQQINLIRPKNRSPKNSPVWIV